MKTQRNPKKEGRKKLNGIFCKTNLLSSKNLLAQILFVVFFIGNVIQNEHKNHENNTNNNKIFYFHLSFYSLPNHIRWWLYMPMSLLIKIHVHKRFSQEHFDIFITPILCRQILQENDNIVEFHFLDFLGIFQQQSSAHVHVQHCKPFVVR